MTSINQQQSASENDVTQDEPALSQSTHLNDITHDATAVSQPTYFITSPVDNDRINAFKDAELRPYLREEEQLNKLVKAGILLADGRVVCSKEQWSETRLIILQKIAEQEVVSKSLEKRSWRRSTEKGSTSGSPPRNYYKEDKPETSAELWGNMKPTSNAGPSREKSVRKGSAASQQNVSKPKPKVPGKASSVSTWKEEQDRKKLKEQDALNKKRIAEQVRRDEQKREAAAAHRESVPAKSSRKSLNSANSDTLAGRIDRADMRVLSTLQGSSIRLRTESSGLLSVPSSSHSFSSVDNPEKLYFDLWKRQDRLFRALGQRNIDEIPALIDAIPPSLDRRYEEIYKEYNPNIELQKLLSDLICSKITTDTFYKDASALVKMMHPGRIIEYFGKYIASMNKPTKLIKVMSKNSTTADRYRMTWTGEPLARDRAIAIGARLVDDVIEHARTVHTYLTDGSGANLSMLGIGRPDPKSVPQKKIQVGDLIIESQLDEHVSFNERNVVRPRPLDGGKSVSELKPVGDRPPTPIPDEERARRKSKESISRKASEAKQRGREMIIEVREEAEKRLIKKMSQDIKDGKRKPQQKRDPTLPVASGLLHDRVQEKLREWKILELTKSVHQAKRLESLSELVPDLQGPQRQKYIRNLSRQVSSIVAQTIQQAQDIILDAMNMPIEPVNDDDSDDYESVSSTVPTEVVAGKPSEDTEDPAEDFQPMADPAPFNPMFGSKEMTLDRGVLASSLAAISVRHGTDAGSHADHDHSVPVSHMRQFFKSRTSMPVLPSNTIAIQMQGRKRHSMPAILPECMDPNKIHDRNSFMSLVRPNVKDLAEYHDMTMSQVERVMKDHSLFGNIQEASGDNSDEELTSEDLTQADEEIVPKFRRERLEAAVPPDDEARDSVSALPNIEDTDESPRTVASMPTRFADSESWDDAEEAPPKTQSLTQPRVLIRCDSDPRLSLHSSRAEVQVDIHQHSQTCEHHESHDEPERELQQMESKALGMNPERTSSDTIAAGSHDVVNVRKTGSADEAADHQNEVDSDDETELRVREPDAGLEEVQNR